MNVRRCLRIADRLNHLLKRRVGLGIDAQRLLTDALYTRDVLLVCDAHQGSDLASLARHFRIAAAEPESRSGVPSLWGDETTGFGASRPLPSSLFGDEAEDAAARARPAGWFSATRWLGPK